MAVLIGAQVFTFRDAKGYTWTFRFHIHYDDSSAVNLNNGFTVATAVKAALQGVGPGTLPLTNATYQRSIGLFSETSVAVTYGTAAQYLNAEDKLMLAFSDTGGALHRYGIGSPVTAAFLADQETGKASQLVDLVNAFTTTVGGNAFACTANGLGFVSSPGGLLIRRRQRRKVNLYTKSSNLDEPGE
jgi:hypothetical protein